jgi:hypothetical protein
MLKSTIFTAVALILPHLSAALSPAAPRSSRDTVGAAYCKYTASRHIGLIGNSSLCLLAVINNDLDKNVVMVHNILSDGTVVGFHFHNLSICHSHNDLSDSPEVSRREEKADTALQLPPYPLHPEPTSYFLKVL